MSVFVNGTFDILHPGHIALLRHAKSYGEYLYVAIDSDRRVKQRKGPTRPHFNQSTRQTALELLGLVDTVHIFEDNQQLESLVFCIRPNIMIVGSDYINHNVIGSQYAKRLEFFQRDDRYSTTQIIESNASR